VQLGNMDCMVNPEDDKEVTFLYKLVPGPCSKSYGLNVARLARLSTDVIARAEQMALQFEAGSFGNHEDEAQVTENMDLCQAVLNCTDLQSLSALQQQIKAAAE
jgi:DNA mismatch repair ATPase MutS